MTSLADAQYTLDLCARIAAHTDVPGTITRTFLSPATHGVHALLRAEMQALGMAVRTDSVGNLRGTYPGTYPGLYPDAGARPTLLVGSHIDTVPNAGAFDGILGVALPLALLRALHRDGLRLPYAVELIAFSEEEGVRFKLPFIGSRALTGTLPPEALTRTDAGGITLAQAIRDFGLDPSSPSDTALTPGTFAFLEIHIEQGPVLDALDLPLGVVSTIVGQSRFELTFTGQANHAGTTPMHLRKDALAAAALWITHVEALARQQNLVATVGAIAAWPGAANVIPGQAVVSLDVRHAADATRLAAARELIAQAESLAAARSLTVSIAETSQQPAVPLDPALRAALKSAVGPCAHELPSGAGHDAMILAGVLPTAMLFVRSPHGISHHPSESVRLADVDAALNACSRFLTALTPTRPDPP